MESQHQQQPFDAIPNEIIVHIISYARPHDINNFAITCKRMSDIAEDFLYDQYHKDVPDVHGSAIDDFIDCAANGHNRCLQAYIGNQSHNCRYPFGTGNSLECIHRGRKKCIRQIREYLLEIDVRVSTPKRASSLTLSECAIVAAAGNKKYNTVIYIYTMFGRKYVPSPMPMQWTKSIICRTIHDIMLEATYHIARRCIAEFKEIDKCKFCSEPCTPLLHCDIDDQSNNDEQNNNYHIALREYAQKRARTTFQICFADIVFVDKHGMPNSAAGLAYMRRFFAICASQKQCMFDAESRGLILRDMTNAANCGPMLAAKEYMRVMKNLTPQEIFDDLCFAAFFDESWVIAAFSDDDLIKHREFMGAAAKFILERERISGEDYLSAMPKAHIEYLIDVAELDDAEIERVIELADTTGVSYINCLIARFSMERVKRVCDERDTKK